MTLTGAIRSSPIARPTLLAEAIETDRAYFEMGASVRTLPGAVLAWMPGFSASPAAAVIHRVNPVEVAGAETGWVGQVEEALMEVGASFARIYLDAPDKAVGELLRNAGYVDRDELIFTGSIPLPSTELKLRPVISEADWARKLAFHREAEITPDGHHNDPSDWVALEKRKCASGMEAFLAEIDREPVGAIGAIWRDGLLRLKNIVVHPARRRRAVGQAMLARLSELGRARGVFEQCVLAVRGEVGEYFYRAIGLQPIGVQVEWSKRLGDPAQ